MQLQEKRLQQRNYPNLKGKHNEKIKVKPAQKHGLWLDTHKNHENSFCTKKPSPTR